MIKEFIHSFITFEIFLILLSFFVIGKIDYFQITFRALIFSFLISLALKFKSKIEEFVNFNLLAIFILIILATYFFSSSENLEKIDLIFGIQNLTYKIRIGEISFFEKIGTPEIFKRALFPNETLEMKVLEFRNNSLFLEKEIHNLVNKVRAEYNLSILKFSEELSEIARYHSKDMAINDYFDHTSPKGETLKDRFLKFNFTCRIIVGNYIYEGAENLFMSYIYSKYYYDKITGKIVKYEFKNLEDIAKEAVNGWLNSESHRKNMLFEHWKSEGIGVYISDSGKVYVTQVFC
ncbi:MAG: CAP domain-containing protein [Candidatus Aenigmatarchaeota archaeon]